MLEKIEYCEECNGSGWVEDSADDCIGNSMDFNRPCSNCDGEGEFRTPIKEDEIVFVNVYSITRHYGGPEEGGWYYNWNACIESVPVQNQYSDLMKEKMEEKYFPQKHGNIYSVLGGVDIEVRIESEPKESETKGRPHYE